jgi:glycosyltransferase involved in cell wall biosynthesis
MSAAQRAEVEAVRELVATDKRVRIIDSPSDSKLASVLATWDALVVPSFWLESGPEVIYEAFAVKTPAIGSRRGGIAELVEEGKSGFLFSPTNADELTSLLIRFANDPSELRAMRNRIGPVRTTKQVAEDMEQMYRSVASGE